MNTLFTIKAPEIEIGNYEEQKLRDLDASDNSEENAAAE